MMPQTQRYLVDGHIRTRIFHPERPQDDPFRNLDQKSQPQQKIEVEAHQVDKSSDLVHEPTARKELCAVKGKSAKRNKKKATKETSSNPGLFRILFLGGRWAHNEDVQPGIGNRTSYAAPMVGWRPLGGTRQ